MAIIWADWSLPNNIIAGVSDRTGGFSKGAFNSNNMGLHVGDDALSVEKNRVQLQQQLEQELKRQSAVYEQLNWQWLEQVHGTHVIEASHQTISQLPEADAVLCDQSFIVASVMTADCLPILLCTEDGAHTAAIHAGWRSLCHGIIEETVLRIQAKTDKKILAWFGPAIGADVFEVGHEVKSAFVAKQSQAESAFSAQGDGKYLADIYQLASLRFARLGIADISGGQSCTYKDDQHFFSYRKHHETGRMVSFIVKTSQ